ncbi:hypothetical protein AB1Y20_017938 [Prymnesium parvum]|uniref:RING-type E3 ubiquitin transferase n=1 Tax=Prymnesium parvum TaxID=97485 RepID=A0AB34JLN2_PRYPA
MGAAATLRVPAELEHALSPPPHGALRDKARPPHGPPVDVTCAFCRADDLSMAVRSCQCVRQGCKVMHANRLVALCTARNYFSADGQANDAEMLLLARDGNGCLRH